MPAPRKKSTPKKSTSRARVRDYRARMRAKGMRQVTLWVPDVRSPEFLENARKACLAIARSEQEKDDQAFVEAISAGVWDDE
jgi:hypothetical protein